MTESKSGVLPLHYKAVHRSIAPGRGKLHELSTTWQPGNLAIGNFYERLTQRSLHITLLIERLAKMISAV